MTFKDLRKYCKANKIKYTTPKHGGKTTITKPRCIKISLDCGSMICSYWDSRRKSYTSGDKKHINQYDLAENADISAEVWDAVVEALETTVTETSGFKIDKRTFTDNAITKFTNGLVRSNVSITQALVLGVAKITDRGLVKEVQPTDDCECWFLIDGKSRGAECKKCSGTAIRILYDGEKYWVPIEKTNKSYRISDTVPNMSTIDKFIVDAAVKLFLTLKEKDEQKV